MLSNDKILPVVKTIKCIVWDLDNTIWDGICLYGNVTVKVTVEKVIKELDKRGILHSIASRGDPDTAMNELKKNNLDMYFLSPKINWSSKSKNITEISKELNIPFESIAFIDDDPFEREQVSFMLPEVMVIDALDSGELVNMKEFNHEGNTSEASQRRLFYKAEEERKKSEQSFAQREDFLVSCCMRLKIRKAVPEDIPRILELMTRTHQLNTTGLIISNEDAVKIVNGDCRNRWIYVAELTDKFSNYGLIGTAIYEQNDFTWVLKYMALSCRVMGRGIEQAFLSYMLNTALAGGAKMAVAEYRETGKNRMMRALYQMAGFKCYDEEITKFTKSIDDFIKYPKWIKVL